jgi:hypothetical protein
MLLAQLHFARLVGVRRIHCCQAVEVRCRNGTAVSTSEQLSYGRTCACTHTKSESSERLETVAIPQQCEDVKGTLIDEIFLLKLEILSAGAATG